MQKYKLRFYHKSGAHKGNLSHEEFFNTREEMDIRYKEVFVQTDYSLNPTAYEATKCGAWKRIMGY